MPKVAHITTVDLSLRYFLLNQLRSIRQAGYEVVGISTFGPDVPVIEAAGIRHIDVPITRRISPVADLKALARLVQILRNERFTIVHTHTPKISLLGQLAARIAGVPIVCNTVHGFFFHEHMAPWQRRFYVMMERIAALCSDVVFSQNREDVETALTERICRPDQIRFLGNGIDLKQFDRSRLDPSVLRHTREELGLPSDVRVVGFVGRLVAEKGLFELFTAAKQIAAQHRDVRFLIIGACDSAKADAWRPELAADFGIEDVCVFPGIRQDMPELYALMDVFVLPSHREGYPRVSMEASAMGVPCVVTDIRGCREVVEHGYNGLLTPLKDPIALTTAILTLLEDPDTARRMGEAGRRMARERFDEQIVFAKIKAEYARLLQTRGLAPRQVPVDV